MWINSLTPLAKFQTITFQSMDPKFPSSQIPMQTPLCCAEKDPIVSSSASSSSSSSLFSFFSLSSNLMGIRHIAPPAKPPLPPAHHHGFHHPQSLFAIIMPIILTTLLFSIVLLLVIFRKLRSSNNNSSNSSISNSCSSNNSRSKNKNKKKLSKCTSSILSFNAGHDVRSCIYGSNGNFVPSPSTATKSRGAQVFTYKELELACEKFSKDNVIGNGGFGVVYKGVLSDGTVAAIKKLHREGKQGEREFRVEVDLLSRLHSPYLLELLGYCADQHHRLLVFEFMPNGNLQHHLHPNGQNGQPPPPPLDWGTRLRIALDCARGLEYLHELTVPTVIHRDFKCSNVLLDRNYRAKVSDFGLAKMGSDKINGQISTRVLGTTGYVAPEYASTGKLTTKSDVYSFGVVLLELITGRVPVDTKRPPGEHVLVSWALPRLTNREKVAEMVDPVLQDQYSKKELIQVAAIAAVCVQSEADYRPLMTDVVQSLIPLVKHTSTTGPTVETKYPHQSITIRSLSIDNGSSSTSTNSPHF